MSEKLANLGPLKIKVFWNKGYDVIISAYDVTDKILSRDSYHIIDVVMWQKFGNSSISMREVYHNLNCTRIWPEKTFARCSWFKFNNLWLTLGIALKFYTSVTEGLKLKVRKFFGLVPMIAEVTGEKLVGVLLGPHILNRKRSYFPVWKRRLNGVIIVDGIFNATLSKNWFSLSF